MEISSLFSSQSSIDLLISQMIRLEQGPRDNLVTRKDLLTTKKKTLSELDSKLTALKTKADRLTDEITNYFAAKKVSSSDTNKITATAGYNSANGNHSLTVARLASSDTRVSQQYNNTDISFSAFTSDQIFTIEVGSPTDDDPNNRVEITVNVAASAFSQTNDDVLTSIADAINSAMYNAVTADSIESDQMLHASVVSEENGKSRLVLRSENTGYTYRMDFGASSLLDGLQVNNNAQSSGTAGGYITEVGSDASSSLLNSQFTLDGLTFYRDSNSVTNAISGITLQLLDTFTSPVTVTVTSDVDTVKKEVQDFLDAYNDVRKYLKEKTQINKDTYVRGELADDFAYRDIYYSLHNLIMQEVSGTASSSYTKLYNIGIETDGNGILSISDVEKFTQALETNPAFISDIFNVEDGVASTVESYLDNYVKTGGTIDGSKRNLENEITGLGDRIKFMNELLSKRELTLRNEFSKLQETMIILQNQQSFFGLFATI